MLWHLKNFGKHHKKSFALFAGVLMGFSVLMIPFTVFAAPAFDFGLSDLSRLGLGNADIRVIIIRLIQVALGFLGIVAVSIVLYGGYLWMTSAGNAQRVEQAKQVLKNGLIGLVIILSAYTIVAFVIGTFIDSILSERGGGPGGGPCTNCSALGGVIIEDHYPARNATVTRNAAHVTITFKEPIFVSIDGSPLEARSFIADATFTAPDTFTGYSSGATATLSPPATPPTPPPPPIFLLQEVFSNNALGPEVKMKAITTGTNQRIFSLYPQGLLGNSDYDTRYRATIKGGTYGLTKKADNSKGAMGGDYTWDFTVSTEMDTTPPKVIDVYPVDGQTEARNVSVVMTFSEPIDPVSIVYAVSPSPNTILFHQTPPNPNPDEDVDGKIEVTNGYRTITFRTNTKCGLNSCGQDIFCFNANSQVDGLVKAATLVSDAGKCDQTNPVNVGLLAQNNPSAACVAPTPALFFDGIVDMAGNSLDGSPGVAPKPPLPSGDGAANGPPADSYVWTFNTDDKIVKGGPKVLDVQPDSGAGDVSREDPAKAEFNRRLFKFTTDDFRFYENNAPFNPIWARQSVEYKCGVSGEACFPPSQPKKCVGGSRDNQPCNKQEDCNPPDGVGGNTCNTIRVCRGGTNDGKACTADADCPGTPVGVCPIASCSAPPAGEERNDCGRSTAELWHGTFAEDQIYEPRLGSSILDIYQNCYSPAVGPKICENNGTQCATDADCGVGACVLTTTSSLGQTGLDLDAP